MNFDVKKTYLIIANSSYESLLLKFRKNNPLINFKFISSSKFKKMFSFSYDKDIFFNFFNKLNLKDKKLNEYNYFSSFIRYIDLYKPSKSYDFSDFLKAKDYLMENNLILKQNYEVYINLLKNKEILLLNLDYDDEIKILLNNLNVNYTHINTKYLGFVDNFDKKVLKFRTVFEQLDYVFNSICDTIKSERALNKNSNIEKNIVINCNYEKYEFYLKYFSKTYHLPIIYEKRTRLIDTFGVRNVLNECYINKSFISFLNSPFLTENPNLNGFLHEMIENCNDFDLIYKNIVQYLSSTIIVERIGDKGILVTNEKTFDNKKHYILDFYDGIYPKNFQDNDFILDEAKKELHINQSYMKYKLDEIICKDFISLNNVDISYSLNTVDRSYISNLASELELKVEPLKIVQEKLTDYSRINSILKYQLYTDDLKKYSRKNELYLQYDNEFKENVKSFDYSFKKFNEIPENKIEKYSQTLLENYASCPFKFFIDNILQLNIFEPSFAAEIGKLCHSVLENVYSNDFDNEFEKALKNFTYTNEREKIIIPKIKIMLKKAVEHILEHSDHINFLRNDKNYSTGKEVTLHSTLSNHEIMGRIDSIIFSEENNKKYYSIIDYKTGGFSFNINKLKDNESLQLPLYILLSNNDKYFSNYKFGGAYIQSILNENEYLKKDLEAGEQLDKVNADILKSFRYNGIFNDDEDYYKSISGINKIDKNNSYVKPIKRPDKNHLDDIDLSCGVDNKKFDYILETCEEVVLNLINSIESFNFDILPKNEDSSFNSACKNCSYKSICYICSKRETSYILSDNDSDDSDEEGSDDE